ncbi:MAG: phenylacetate-CoA oxygenase subunit PaaJ [Crocinitomicaceae bacterium]|nr:phenylacetate-CoA oxygenase subunit PaaJ [Crocinitomicaceae bacterium]MBK8927751.1 phenylacetate-CoA oxygenase subunit PaaJ [Crocinitomicaceae bacterium]MBK8927976.1 phenylacetate-CoA oxygenase subunit PaaJ [Crocinitomicaceae bacterium]
MVTEKEFNHLWEILNEVPDPEIPVISLVELGVIRKIVEYPDSQTVEVIITPTYTGCPAKKLFEDLIREKLAENGYNKVNIISQLHPVWTTDWLSDETKSKLLAEGISPPTIGNKIVMCPRCKSTNTKMISAFGSTPCQAMYSCNECSEPFNYFKCY